MDPCASLLPLSTSMILQLPPNATEPSPMFSSLRRQGFRKTICCQAVSPPPFPAPDTDKCLTISDLVTSYGLSSGTALYAARFATSKNKEKLISVICLLDGYGFSHGQIDNIARKYPQLLMVANPEQELKPKLDFLLGEGFSKKEVADIVASNAALFGKNLQRGLIPTYRFLSAALPSRSDVVHALKHHRQHLTDDKEDRINMLRENGVSEPVILNLIKRYPRGLMKKTENLEYVVKMLIEMGVDPKTKKFSRTLDIFSSFSKATWPMKLKLFKELGWSESEVFDTVKKHPLVFVLSDERLRFTVDFFKRSIGWDQAFIIKNASLLIFQLENRIIPRVSILKMLMSKGLIKNKWSYAPFRMTDEYFFEEYVKKYVAEVPEIIKYGKTICCQVESPPFSALDTEKCFTISYLVTSCGLSSDAALYVARFVTSKNKEKPISVIRLLKGYGLSHGQIDNIAGNCSSLMVANAEKILKPKLDFLLDEGFSKKEVADILASNGGLFQKNLERGLISTYRFLSAILPSRSDVVYALKCKNLTADKEDCINMLRESGVSEPVILYLIKLYPMGLMKETEHLEDAVKKLIEMGVDPKTKNFALSLRIFCSPKVTWLSKVKLFKELGWSESEVIDMFKRYPTIFRLSDERLRFTVDFFKRSIGWDQALMIKNHSLLKCNINKIIPRVPILKMLMSKGLVQNKWKPRWFRITDEHFFEKYVKKYVAEVPEIMRMYEDTVALEQITQARCLP